MLCMCWCSVTLSVRRDGTVPEHRHHLYLLHDGPNYLGLLCNALPQNKMARITSDLCCRGDRAAAGGDRCAVLPAGRDPRTGGRRGRVPDRNENEQPQTVAPHPSIHPSRAPCMDASSLGSAALSSRAASCRCSPLILHRVLLRTLRHAHALMASFDENG